LLVVLKRAIDIVVGTVLAVLTLPFVLVFAVGCALSLRAWPFFVQQRVGKDGKSFPLPKLRTLPASVPRAIDKYELGGTRIPPFCRLLRRTHLDELPQLLVVPLGWMSLVGPRPEMPNLLGRYPSDFVASRSSVRPGCTGLWQVSTASGRLIYESPEYDLVYANYRGLALDFWILYHTLRMLVTRRATIDLDDVPSWAIRRGRRAPVFGVEGIDPREQAAPDAVVIDLREHGPRDVTAVDGRDSVPSDALVIDLREEDRDAELPRRRTETQRDVL
jgi:lipopolysaccharide/colanic/teichoic acid biosynthesis glycosyltransferase